MITHLIMSKSFLFSQGSAGQSGSGQKTCGGVLECVVLGCFGFCGL